MTELKSIKNYSKGIYEVIQRISNNLVDTKGDDTITFHLNSDQGIQKNTINGQNVDFQLSKPIFLNNSIGMMAVRSGSIPRSFYVVDGTNCKFDIIIGSTTYNIELLHGNYDVRQLTTIIADLVNTATSSTPSLSITYSITSNKFTWTFASTTSTITLDTDVLHSAYRLLGEPKDQHVFTASGGDMVHTSENVVNVTQINSLQIHVGELSFNEVVNTSGKTSNIIHKYISIKDVIRGKLSMNKHPIGK